MGPRVRPRTTCLWFLRRNESNEPAGDFLDIDEYPLHEPGFGDTCICSPRNEATGPRGGYS